MARINAPLAFFALLALVAVVLLGPPGVKARSSLAGVGEEISSMEHTLAVLEGRDLAGEDEDEDQDIIEVDDDEDDGVEPRMFADVPPTAESDIDAGKRNAQFGLVPRPSGPRHYNPL